MTVLISLPKGKYIDLLDPDPSVIEIEEIAHRLSNICRWLGGTKYHYSVAQHSSIICDLVPKDIAMQALLHDATEAYMGDLVTPLKVHFPDFAKMEDNLWAAIADKFGLPRELDPRIRAADKRIGLTEKKYLLGPGPAYHSDNHEPYTNEEFEPVTGRSIDQSMGRILPEVARDEFLQRFDDLCNNR